MLPNEIMLNIISYLDLYDQLRIIKLYNLPKKIPKKLNIARINKLNNLILVKSHMDKILSVVYESEYYMDLSITLGLESRNNIMMIINSYINYINYINVNLIKEK
jgi:hypothetical protein